MRRGMTARRGQIAGSSMEPTLRGPRVHWTCPNCGSARSYAMDAWKGNRELQCVSCRSITVAKDGVNRTIAVDEDKTKVVDDADDGNRSEATGDEAEIGEVIEYLPVRANARLRKDSFIESDSDPSGLRRFDIVVIQEESNSGREVKRVIGLPGEQVSVRSGDLWIGERRYKKSLDQLLRQSVLVGSWQPDSARIHNWELISSDGEFSGTLASAQDEIDETAVKQPLAGIKRVRSFSFANRDSTVNRVRNDLELNAHDTHELVPVDDLGVTFRIENATPDWQLKVELRGATGVSRVELTVENGRVAVHVDGREVALQVSPQLVNPLWVVVARVDGEVVIGEPRSEWARCSIEVEESEHGLADGGGETQEGPFDGCAQVQILRGTLVTDRWMLFRDLHYRGAGDTPEQSVHCEGLLLLGDNISTSSDGRTRWHGGLEVSRVRGVVLQPANPLDSLLRQSEP